VVTDPDAAAQVGAEPGAEVLVAPPRDATVAATALARDPVLAAALSRQGRRLVERRFDLAPGATELAGRLGLTRLVPSPAGRVDAALAELRTPPGARPAVRAAAALSAFGRVVVRSRHQMPSKRAVVGEDGVR
jgi:hypothetical protein